MDFDALNKKFANSFNEQKALIKKLSQGKQVRCPDCGQVIALSLIAGQEKRAAAKCPKGCTTIEFDLA